MIKFYGYKKCSTCRNAEKYLAGKKLDYKDFDITQTPPSKAIFKAILKSGDYELKHLLNTSGVMYREMKMKDKLKTMSEAQVLDLLSKEGRLVKRPIVTDGDRFTVGFKDEIFKSVWN